MKKINLKGADNARDFGGTVNKKDQTIKSKMFIRSNCLYRLTEKDVSILRDEYHLAKIIDLRTDEEVAEKPDITVPGATWIHIPIFNQNTLGITHEKSERKKAASLSNIPKMTELYKIVVTDEYSISQLKKVFEAITEDTSGATLWHCTEGKDRCGIVSALFLALLDVNKTTVTYDYLLTNKVSKKRATKYFWKVLLLTFNFKNAVKIRSVFSADAEYLCAAFDAIKQEYGSVNKFIEKKLGISEETKEKMQKICLE